MIFQKLALDKMNLIWEVKMPLHRSEPIAAVASDKTNFNLANQ
jgi:hypothetical protein